MSSSHRTFALLFVVLGLIAPSRGQNLPATFESANNLYYAGKFQEAATAYEKLLQAGERSAAVYFNLGNALLKTGQVGRAVANYHEAERLAPRDPDVRANLQFARNQVQGPSLSPTRWERWLARLTLNEWALLSAAGVWLCFILLALIQLRPALRASLRPILIALGPLTVLLCVCSVTAYRARASRIAVVVTRDVVIHQGPLDVAQTAFIVHDGAELRVLEHKDDWLLVSTDPRRIGWVKRDKVVIPFSI